MRTFATALVAGITASGLTLASPYWAGHPAPSDSASTAAADSSRHAHQVLLATGALTPTGAPRALDVVLAAASTTPDPAVHSTDAHGDLPDLPDLPTTIHGGAWPTSHVQGVALDRENGFMYWSFTQMLVKTDLDGDVIGTVEGITGHLGSLDLSPLDGRVYGSLEYKADEAFYIAIFDGAAIDRIGMDAATDGVLTTVHLREVVDDYTADMDGDGHFDGDTGDTADHRYGCGGIDGLAFGPEFGTRGGPQKLMVAYGVYANTERADNDHQVILEYDVTDWEAYEQPLDESAPHRGGPDTIDGKYFTHTGNTRYGVQNLEYDPHTGNWLMAVYPGAKAEFPNYSFFIVDGSVAPRHGRIKGQPKKEYGKLLTLLNDGPHDPESGTYGWEFHGDFGIEALGDGYYYFAEGGAVIDDGRFKQDAEVHLHRWTGEAPAPFVRVGGRRLARLEPTPGYGRSAPETGRGRPAQCFPGWPSPRTGTPPDGQRSGRAVPADRSSASRHVGAGNERAKRNPTSSIRSDGWLRRRTDARQLQCSSAQPPPRSTR